jgi:HEAT repeat protein
VLADVRVAAAALARLREEYEARYGQTAPVEELLRRSVDARAATLRLGQAATDADPEEKAAICVVLGVLADDAAIPLLISMLNHPGEVGSAAHQALRRLGQRSDVLLAEALRAADSAARALLLPLVSSGVALPEVTAALADPEPDARAAACGALARIGNPAVAEALFGRLEDSSPLVVQSAIAAIQSLGSPRTEALALAAAASSSSARVRRWALRIIAYFGYGGGLPAVLAAIDDPDPAVRDSAIHALPFMEGPVAREALLAAARGAVPASRAAAVRALGNAVGDARGDSAVLGALDDGDPWVRYYACQSAGRLRIDSAVPALARLLGDPAGQVRVGAIEGLSHFDVAPARQALMAAARAGEEDVRRAAIIGLGIGGRLEALPTVVEALRAADVASRLVAVSALGGFDDPSVNELLGGMAGDPDEAVRNGAVGALAARPGPEATSVLIGLLERAVDGEAVWKALAVPSPDRVAGILAALERADDELAPSLASALARMGDAAGAAALLRALALANPSARKAAAATLGGLGSREALAAVRTAAVEDPHPEVRRVCAAVLV